jgi:hypothetical protein
MGWTEQTTVKGQAGGKSTVLKRKDGEQDLSNLELQQVGDTVQRAREMLLKVIGMLSWPVGDDKHITTSKVTFISRPKGVRTKRNSTRS